VEMEGLNSLKIKINTNIRGMKITCFFSKVKKLPIQITNPH
jgi:hypothetical protein